MIFRGHPLGRNILGNPEQLKQFRSEDAAAFTARFYHPNNMVFFVLGNLSFKKVVLMAKNFWRIYRQHRCIMVVLRLPSMYPSIL